MSHHCTRRIIGAALAGMLMLALLTLVVTGVVEGKNVACFPCALVQCSCGPDQCAGYSCQGAQVICFTRSSF